MGNGGDEAGLSQFCNIFVVRRSVGSARTFPTVAFTPSFLKPIKTTYLGRSTNPGQEPLTDDSQTSSQRDACDTYLLRRRRLSPPAQAVWHLPLVGLGGFVANFYQGAGDVVKRNLMGISWNLMWGKKIPR